MTFWSAGFVPRGSSFSLVFNFGFGLGLDCPISLERVTTELTSSSEVSSIRSPLTTGAGFFACVLCRVLALSAMLDGAAEIPSPKRDVLKSEMEDMIFCGFSRL